MEFSAVGAPVTPSLKKEVLLRQMVFRLKKLLNVANFPTWQGCSTSFLKSRALLLSMYIHHQNN